MSSVTIDPKVLRELIVEALPEHAQAENSTPAPGQRFLPVGHVNALQLDRPLVEGGRGSGKTFWSQSLQDREARKSLASAFDAPQLDKLEVSCGFDPSRVSEAYPGVKVINSLLNKNVSMTDFWFAVVVGLCIPETMRTVGWANLDWPGRCDAVQSHAELIDTELRKKNQAKREAGSPLLIVFDGLDRAASGPWSKMTEVTRGLMETVLEFSRFDSLRLKVFLRDDIAADPAIRRFPDASKLFANRVRLEWSRADLYGLLWQYLGNANGSETFRNWSSKLVDSSWGNVDTVHVLPEVLRSNEAAQERLFHHVAGERMGAGLRKGNTWKWLPMHLKDTLGYTSPRSFLVALRAAANTSGNYTPIKQQTALHWRAIEEGVRNASSIRRDEIAESHPWIDDVLNPLSGLPVPARRQDIVARWRRDNITDKVVKRVEADSLVMPSGFDDKDPSSLLAVLKQLGLCDQRSDGRMDFPDIVRISANMPRKGGVALTS